MVMVIMSYARFQNVDIYCYCLVFYIHNRSILLIALFLSFEVIWYS